jgi:hypothetical protein
MGKRDESNRTEFGLKRDHRTIENRSGGTHPGAEHGAMGGSLMMGMVPGMLDRLRLRQSADGKDTEHQEDRREFEDDAVHQRATQCDLVECYWTPTRPVKSATSARPLHIIGFMEKILYTAQNTFGDIGVRSEGQYHGHATTQPNLRQ